MAVPIRAVAAVGVLALVATTLWDTCRAQEVFAYNEKRPDLDYEAFRGAVPQFKTLGAEALDDAKLLLDLMDKLAATEKDASKAARAEARDLLVRYRDNKVKVAALADTVLKHKGSGEADMEILKKLRQTELVGISWNQTKFVDCLRDLAQALQVTFVMHPDVLKFNTVEITFPRSPADGILRTITAGFDCDYIVYNGEKTVHEVT